MYLRVSQGISILKRFGMGESRRSWLLRISDGARAFRSSNGSIVGGITRYMTGGFHPGRLKNRSRFCGFGRCATHDSEDLKVDVQKGGRY